MNQKQDSDPTTEDHWDGSLYRNMRSFAPLIKSDLVEFLAPQSHERIFDFGCGTGRLTAQIAKHGSRVVGLDPSPDMIEVARQKHPTLNFFQADIFTYTPTDQFDAVFSSDVLHWIPDPRPTLRELYRMLLPEGRMVAECGARGNVERIRSEIHAVLEETGYDPVELDPWYFPPREEYVEHLEACGFQVETARTFEKTAVLNGQEGLRLWLAMFGDELFAPLTELERETVVRKLEDRLQSELFVNGKWRIDYNRLRFRVGKESETILTPN